jgi:hypothetical protein
MCAAPRSDAPPACSKCSGRGAARFVEIKNQQRTVQYVCETCGERWHLTTNDEPYWLWTVVVRSPAAERPEHAAQEPPGNGRDDHYIKDEP